MSCTKPYLEVLSDDDVRQIHLTALRVLEEVGLWLPQQEVLETFQSAGAWVDFTRQSVRIPAHLVQAAIQRMPPRFTWHARRPEHTLDVGGHETHFQGPDSAIHVIDLHGQRRPGTLEDGEAFCRLCDALPNLAVAATGLHPAGLSTEVLDVWFYKTVFTHSSKAVFAVSRSRASSQNILRMAEVVAESCGLPAGQLPLMACTNTVSPLYNTPHELEGMLEYIRRGVPLLISPEVQAGASGPATLAGLMVQATAEFLGHATLAQLITPGMPILFGCVSNIFDMRQMIPPYGSPEADLLCIATAQMARYYGIPCRGTGGSSDANALGMQAGAESLMSTLIPLLAGVHFVAHGAGELENTLGVSYEKMLIDDELIGMARRLAAGIIVTPETLAFETIRQVGPRGSYLETEHTARHFRSEQYLPRLWDREKHELWQAGGAKRAEERARERVQCLLAGHQPAPLPAEAERELTAIYAHARRAAGME